MSLFTELTTKLDAISLKFVDCFKAERESIQSRLDKFAEDYQNEKNLTKSKKKTLLTTLQSIDEDDVSDEKKQSPNTDETVSNSTEAVSELSQPVINKEDMQISKKSNAKRASKKRGKEEVDGIFSPELDKRQKRSASVRALSHISKQLKDDDKQDGGRRRKAKNEDSDKENSVPPATVSVKLEKMSMATEEAMDVEEKVLKANFEVKKEMGDNASMPPPAAPRPRRAAKDRSKQKLQEMALEEDTGRRTRARTKKTIDAAPPVQTAEVVEEPPVQEARPKRTKKKPQKEVSQEKEHTQQPSESDLDTPVKPKTKRTKKAPEKTASKQDSQDIDPPLVQDKQKDKPSDVQILQEQPKPQIIKQERTTEQYETTSSPILQNVKPKTKKAKELNIEKQTADGLDQTRVINKNLDVTVTLNNCNTEMDRTVILPNGRYDHAPVTPKAVHDTDKTVVLDKVIEPIIPVPKDVSKSKVMNETVVLSKESAQTENITDDNSLLTNDSTDSEHTPPRLEKKTAAPTSAVKEKVQKFEELASRVTRTKTRALAKEMEENATPPDQAVPSKSVLSAETINKMNNMIFNGKPPVVSSSATKPKTNNIVSAVKSFIPSSTSKVSALAKAREAAEEASRAEKEDAKKKKEKMLQAKREEQKRKREEKMAAAAAAREAAERDRLLALEAAAKERKEKQAHADQGKLERQREAERKKQEQLRKVAETEERRRAEEQARQHRLAEEQRRAELARKKQQEEAEATRREAALATKEIEKRQKEYIEKQKMKLAADKIHTPLRTPGTPSGIPPPAPMEPVYMADGFQYLNSDSDEDAPAPTRPPVPAWSASKARWQSLMIQSNLRTHHVDRLFSVRTHTPDLRELFPNINRHYLKRTSSAVWRTPPAGGTRLQALPE